jgi:hypothetical protein
MVETEDLEVSVVVEVVLHLVLHLGSSELPEMEVLEQYILNGL